MTAPCLPSCPHCARSAFACRLRAVPAMPALCLPSCPPCVMFRVRSASCSSCRGTPSCQMAASRPHQPHVRSSPCSPFATSCRHIADLRASRRADLYASRCVPPAGCPIAVLPSVVASRLVVALLAVMLDASLVVWRHVLGSVRPCLFAVFRTDGQVACVALSGAPSACRACRHSSCHALRRVRPFRSSC